MSKTGYSLTEYLPGEVLETYNEEQFWSIIPSVAKRIFGEVDSGNNTSTHNGVADVFSR